MAAIVITVVTLICAYGAHVLAARKGRPAKWWVFAALLLGPLPLIPLALLPPQHAPAH